MISAKNEFGKISNTIKIKSPPTSDSDNSSSTSSNSSSKYNFWAFIQNCSNCDYQKTTTNGINYNNSKLTISNNKEINIVSQKNTFNDLYDALFGISLSGTKSIYNVKKIDFKNTSFDEYIVNTNLNDSKQELSYWF